MTRRQARRLHRRTMIEGGGLVHRPRFDQDGEILTDHNGVPIAFLVPEPIIYAPFKPWAREKGIL